MKQNKLKSKNQNITNIDASTQQNSCSHLNKCIIHVCKETLKPLSRRLKIVKIKYVKYMVNTDIQIKYHNIRRRVLGGTKKVGGCWGGSLL